jgi:hypothetical protein
VASLPSDWLDTGVTGTEVLECTLELRAQFGPVALRPDAQIDNVGLQFYTQSAGSDHGRTDLWDGTTIEIDSAPTVRTILYDVDTAVETILNTGSGAATGEPDWLPEVAVKKEFGPLRLGVQIDALGALKYAWFTDVNTTLKYTIDGTLRKTIAFTDPPTRTSYVHQVGGSIASATITGMGTQLQFERTTWTNSGDGTTEESVYTHVRWAAFEAQTVSLTTNTSLAYKARRASKPLFNAGTRFGWSWIYTLNVDCDDAGGTAVAADVTYNGTTYTCPATPAITQEWWGDDFYSPSSEGNLLTPPTFTAAWLATQTVQPYTADRDFAWEGNDPKAPGNAAQTSWNAGSITIASSRSVILSSNAWTPSSGSLTVGGTPTSPTFTAVAAGTSATKTLLEYWRNWNTPAHAQYHADDGYKTTKADYYADAGQDLWGWSLYSYLDVALTTPALTTLTFEITYAVVTQAGTINTIVRTYSKSFPLGASTQRLDLLFPTEAGRPFYGERVDSIKISGFTSLAGTYTLTSMALVPDQQAYLTLGGRSHLLRDGARVYGGARLAQDGAGVALHWGKDTLITFPSTGDLDGDGFTDYRGDHQNGIFLQNGVAYEVYGHAPSMDQTTVQAAIEELHRIEGVTATYSATAMDAAFTDGTNTITPSRDQTWLALLRPHARLTAGAAYTVLAQLRPSGVILAPGLTAATMRVFSRNHLGVVIECLCTNNTFARAGAGETIRARAYTGAVSSPSDTLLATATTDASGYAYLPVRNGLLGGLEFNVHLVNA